MKYHLSVLISSFSLCLAKSGNFYPFIYVPKVHRSSSPSVSSYHQFFPHSIRPVNPFSNHVSALVNRFNRHYFRDHITRQNPSSFHDAYFDEQSDEVDSRRDAGFFPFSSESITNPLKKQDYNYLIWPILFAVLFPFLLGALFLPLALIFLLNLLSLLLVVRQNQSGMVLANPTNRLKRPRRSTILSSSINRYTQQLVHSLIKYK